MSFDVQMPGCPCTYQDTAIGCPIHDAKKSRIWDRLESLRLRVAQDDAVLMATEIIHNHQRRKR